MLQILSTFFELLDVSGMKAAKAKKPPKYISSFSSTCCWFWAHQSEVSTAAPCWQVGLCNECDKGRALTGHKGAFNFL